MTEPAGLFMSRSFRSDSLQPCRLQPARLLCPRNFTGKNTGVGCHSLLRASSWPRDWTCVSYVSSTGTQVLYQLGHLSHKLYSLLLMSNATCYCSTMVLAHPSVKNGRKVKSKGSVLTENLTMKRKYCTWSNLPLLFSCAQ